MELIDTHCHIQSIGDGDKSIAEIWKKDPDITVDSVIGDANKAGISKIICVGTDVSDSQRAVNFVQDKKGLYASVGIHPHEADRYVGDKQQLQNFENLLKSEKVIAIGECGLDYHYSHSSKQSQIEILKFQLDLAITYKLPVIFHIREAFEDFWPIIKDYPDIHGVLHSFTDSVENVNKAIENGFYVGVNGISTFTKEEQQLEAYKAIPLGNLLLETDSPFLTPKPFRGTINQPKRVSNVADFLCELRQEKRADIAAQTTKNAATLFGI